MSYHVKIGNCGARRNVPVWAREAAIKLSGSRDDDSPGVRLLHNIAHLFETMKVDKLSSEQICEALRKMADEPWAEQRLASYKVTRMLSEFGVQSHSIRVKSKTGGPTSKGYVLNDFADTFDRYVDTPPSRGQTGTSAQPVPA